MLYSTKNRAARTLGNYGRTPQAGAQQMTNVCNRFKTIITFPFGL